MRASNLNHTVGAYSEVCGIIELGRGVKLNRSHAVNHVNVHKLLSIRYLRPGNL